MIKKFFTCVLTIYLLLSQFNIYAIDNQDIAYNETYDYTSEVVLEYKPEEQKSLDTVPKIGCKAAYVADPKTGKIFYEKNAHEKMYPASTTKILTALLVLENCKLTDTAIVSENAISQVPTGYSNANLKIGEELTISDLLYAMLIPSANEAANVLAEHVSGSIEDFAELCNNRASNLGCENLHFVNANGLHSDDHYCTAYDLYLIAKECQKYEAFNQIVKTKSYTVPVTNIYKKYDRTYKNTNSLILPGSKEYYYSYCTGIKTGHTTPAGECLVASSSHNNINLISVVLGGGTNSKGLNERFYDTKQLFDFVYNNYSYTEISKNNDVLVTKSVKNATKDTSSLDIIVNTNISTIMPNNFEQKEIPFEIDLADEITAPIKQYQVLGHVTYKVDGLNYTTELIASHNVDKIPYWLYNLIFLIVIMLISLILITIAKNFKKTKK